MKNSHNKFGRWQKNRIFSYFVVLKIIEGEAGEYYYYYLPCVLSSPDIIEIL